MFPNLIEGTNPGMLVCTDTKTSFTKTIRFNFLPPNTEFVAPISILKVNIVKDQVVRNCFQ